MSLNTLRPVNIPFIMTKKASSNLYKVINLSYVIQTSFGKSIYEILSAHPSQGYT